MIGGVDISMVTTAGPSALVLCVRMIQLEWPHAVFESALSGELFARYEDIPFGIASELLVYRDGDAARQWEELGAEPAVHNTMIHLLLSSTQVAIVVDDPEEASISRMLAMIRSGLRMDILNLPVQIRAAA